MDADGIPNGYRAITPYLHIRDAEAAITFYQRAFGAEELLRLTMPDGTIGHAEIRIGDSVVMFAEENADWDNPSPHKLGGTTCGLMMYVPDVDAAFAQAVQAGATVRQEPTDQFYGDRSATLIDPFGHQWTLATHIEDVPPEEMDRRMKAMG